MPAPKRPLLTTVDRARLRRMADKANHNGAIGHNRAYCKGVEDVLRWLDSGEITRLMEEVTR